MEGVVDRGRIHDDALHFSDSYIGILVALSSQLGNPLELERGVAMVSISTHQV